MSIMHSMSEQERAAYKARKTKEIRDYNADLINDLGVGSFFSIVYVLTAPNEEIKLPPKRIPKIYWFMLWGFS